MTSWTALRTGFNAFTQRLPLLMGAWIVIIVCNQVINLLIPDSLFWMESMLPMVVLAPLYAGQHLLALKVVRREPVVFTELFTGLSKWWPILLANLIVSVLTLLGFVAVIIPGIIVALMYSFVLIRFLDPGKGTRAVQVSQALKESAQITRGYRGTLFGIGFLLTIPILLWTFFLMLPSDIPINPWIAEIIAIFGGFLFIGPVQATSFMVVYDHALKHPRG